MAHKTAVLEKEIINRYLRNTTALSPVATVYVALFTAAPTDAYTSGSPDGTECSFSGYARQSITFGAPSGSPSASTNSADVLFPAKADAGSINIVAFGIFDALTNGNLLYWNTITTTALAQNQQAKFAAGNVSISED
jgi:hypothetical protein